MFPLPGCRVSIHAYFWFIPRVVPRIFISVLTFRRGQWRRVRRNKYCIFLYGCAAPGSYRLTIQAATSVPPSNTQCDSVNVGPARILAITRSSNDFCDPRNDRPRNLNPFATTLHKMIRYDMTSRRLELRIQYLSLEI